MNSIRVFGLVLILVTFGLAQSNQFSKYYERRESLFEVLPSSPDDIIILGNSITDGGEWSELFANLHIKNRGISADRTEDVLNRLGTITKGKPAKVFILIGINDLGHGESVTHVINNYQKIIEGIRDSSPKTKIYAQSILPVNRDLDKTKNHTKKGPEIIQVNSDLQKLCITYKVTYIDLYSHFVDSNGKMNPKYSNDGLHLLGAGYLLWKKILQPYIDE